MFCVFAPVAFTACFAYFTSYPLPLCWFCATVIRKPHQWNRIVIITNRDIGILLGDSIKVNYPWYSELKTTAWWVAYKCTFGKSFIIKNYYRTACTKITVIITYYEWFKITWFPDQQEIAMTFIFQLAMTLGAKIHTTDVCRPEHLSRNRCVKLLHKNHLYLTSSSLYPAWLTILHSTHLTRFEFLPGLKH